jgi:hypothetical protein
MDEFEQAMWVLIRVWLGAAYESLGRYEECSSFDYVWQRICWALARGYMRRRRLSGGEEVTVWNALIEAQYPGWEQVQPVRDVG